ncbi:hypothetical protein RB195_020850 [Necator americanus]|uniref:Abnormal cell migration protein 18-like fibronectin type I domain-containing protein n=1 Tax=Necator americanus TaxID=51031 RepID=A0ABR1CP84_NECAM
MRALIFILSITALCRCDCEDRGRIYSNEDMWIDGSFIKKCTSAEDDTMSGWKIEIVFCLTKFYQEVPVDGTREFGNRRYTCERQSNGAVKMKIQRIGPS